eukprot:362010-Chlamydomonas_euryale.AAC.1
MARVLGPERCSRLVWPAAPDQLHGSSAASAFHAEWLVEQRHEQQPPQQQGQQHRQQEHEQQQQWPQQQPQQQGQQEQQQSASRPLGERSLLAGRARAASLHTQRVNMLSMYVRPENLSDVLHGTVDADGGEADGSHDGSSQRIGEPVGVAASARHQASSDQTGELAGAAMLYGEARAAAGASSHAPLAAAATAAASSATPPPANFGAMRMCAHDMLLRDGPEALVWHVTSMAVEWPMVGLQHLSTLKQELLDLYFQ